MAGQGLDRSILVVDGNPDNLRLLEKLLTERHYKARLATSRSRALATVRKEAPDLILLDIMMPGMNALFSAYADHFYPIYFMVSE